MKRLIVLGIAFGLLASACAGGAGTIGPVSPGGSTPPTSGSSGPTATPTASPTDQTFTYELWFAYGAGPWLIVTKRTEEFTQAVGMTALTALLEGPSDAEKSAGVSSAIPKGTELNGLSISDGIATVDLSPEYAEGSGSAAELMSLAQVVYTITQFPTVSGVNFELDGELVESFGGYGIVLDGPQTRADWEDQLPAILVESPLIGEQIDNPVSISGTANVFEATVSIRILDEDGNVIVETFTTATCGTGCRGDFSESVKYSVDHDQPGTVVVFESSAKDGSMLSPVSIPVMLTA